MQDQNKLFDLIKSLTKAEKRYVNLYLSKYEDKFRVLFETINNLDINNETLVKEKYVHEVLRQNGALERDVSSQQVLKSYAPDKRMLYTRILNAIRAYKATNSTEHKLVRFAEDISILLSKGLFEHAKSMLKKAKNIAVAEDQHLHLLKLLEFERGYVRSRSDKNVVKLLEKIRKQELKAIEALSTDTAYRDLHDATFLRLRREHGLRDQDRQEWMDEMLNDPLLKSEETATTFDRKILRMQALANIEQMRHNYEQVKFYNELIVQEFYKRPDIIDNQTTRYLKALNNYISSCYRINDYDEALRVINSFGNYRDRNMEEQAQIFSNIVYQKLHYYLNTEHIYNASDFIEEFITGFHRYEKLIPLHRKLAMFTNIASFRFVTEQFETCAMWAEKMLDERMQNVRIDLKNFANLILLICYCEIGDERLSTKYFRSFSSEIKKHRSKHCLEDRVIGSIYKLRKNGPYFAKDKTKILQKLQNQVDGYKGPNFAGLTELKLWVESKITGQTILERLLAQMVVVQ